MSVIKVIEAPNEVWWETTHEGILEVDGLQVDYRWNESPNGSILFIFEDAGWTSDPSEELVETYDLLWDMLSQCSIDDISTEGEVFDYSITE